MDTHIHALWRNSAFLACRYAGPAMKLTGKGGKERSGGSIICTASGKKIYMACMLLY